MKQVQGLSVAEETSYEEKLELRKKMDVEEIRVGSDASKNEEMVEKTKLNSGEIRVKNFALTENDLGILYFLKDVLYRVSKTEITLDDTRANNNDTSKVTEGEMTDDSDERQDVDAGDTDDTNDEDITTINQNKSNDCSMERVLGKDSGL